MIFFSKNLLYFVIIIVNIIFNLFDKSGERRTREKRAKGSSASTSTILFSVMLKYMKNEHSTTKRSWFHVALKNPSMMFTFQFHFYEFKTLSSQLIFSQLYQNVFSFEFTSPKTLTLVSTEQRFIGAIWSIKDDFNRFSRPYTHYSCLRCVPSPKSYDNIPIRLTMKTFNDCQDFFLFFFNFFVYASPP